MYFNPLPPDGGRRKLILISGDYAEISIHSLRTEGDIVFVIWFFFCINFNPLPPDGGRLYTLLKGFLTGGNFNPLPPDGGRPPIVPVKSIGKKISIHSLRTEGDPNFHRPEIKLLPFQSTPSGRRETIQVQSNLRQHQNFNPLPPDGGRPFSLLPEYPYNVFQSTPSGRRETVLI